MYWELKLFAKMTLLRASVSVNSSGKYLEIVKISGIRANFSSNAMQPLHTKLTKKTFTETA